MTLSILHRMTGVALSFGLIAYVAWLAAIAFDVVSYDALVAAASSPVGKLLLLGWSYAFFFHLSNGIRHLIWDTGRMFSKRQTDASAWFVIACSLLLTAGYWIIV